MTRYPQKRSLDVTELLAQWKEHLCQGVALRRMAHATQLVYLCGASRFAAWCEAEGLSWAHDAAIERWKEMLLREGYRLGTVNAWLAGARAFCQWAIEGVPETGSAVTTWDKAAPSQGWIPLTEAEILRVLQQPGDDVVGRRDRAILAMMAYTAMRSIEVREASVGDLVPMEEGPWLLIVTSSARGRGTQAIIIEHERAVASLREWLQVHPWQVPEAPLFVALGNRSRGERLSTRAIRRIVKEYMIAAGIAHERKTTQSLRYSAICRALREGKSLEDVRAMARVKSLNRLTEYLERAGLSETDLEIDE